MTCREIEDRILDSLDTPSAAGPEIAAHVAGCASCRAFQERQLSFDVALASRFAAPELGPDFDQALARRITAQRRMALWESAPDLLHWGGGLAGTAVCAWAMPEAAGRVVLIGAGFTLMTYFVQTLLRGWIEQSD